MAKEIWRDIPEFLGYQVSNVGRIKSLKYSSQRIMSISFSNGQPQVSLTRNGRSQHFLVHELVMRAFVGPRPSGMKICHLDGERDNNTLDNLVYATWPEIGNLRRIRNYFSGKGHFFDRRIDSQQKKLLLYYLVPIIVDRYKLGQWTLKEAGAKLGITESGMWRLVKGNRRPYLTQHEK